MAYRKKLIEVSLPLEAVNEEASRQKNIRDGHPSTLHLYWSRKPLATCRAVLFSSLVDDPSEYVTGEASILEERERLFKIIEKLVIWENSNDESILNQAKIEIARSIARELNLEMPIGKIAIEEFLLKYAPPLLDPFAGGGSIPLEAQRLGLRVFASDLNPMSVLINKAMIEFPRYCKDKNPLHPISAINQQFSFIKKEWKLAEGLAEDIRYYGTWMGGEAQKRIGHYYPKVNLPVENGGTQAEVIAWIWARSVQCPNPACKIQMPLANSFYISQKKKIWVKPEVDEVTRNVTYHIKTGEIAIPGSVTRQGAICVGCGTPVPFDYIRNEGVSKGLFQVPIAIVAQGKNGRIYLPPTEETKFIIDNIPDSDFLDEIEITDISGYINPPIYGYNTLGKWFTKRQKKTLETFTALIDEAKYLCERDSNDPMYAKIIASYLTLAVGRMANRLSSFAFWDTGYEKINQTFSQQGVGMTWCFAEANPFSGSTGSWSGSLEWIPKCVENFPTGFGVANQHDATTQIDSPTSALISTDPPYYSSITYADLSDFFYGIFRRALQKDFPELFATMSTPKTNEVVAAWHRFGGSRAKAGEHFRNKLQEAVEVMVSKSSYSYPLTFYYAFKEKELDQNSEGYFTAWESILSVLIDGGLQIINTWPVRTESTAGLKTYKNSLASSIVLVCRIRDGSTETITKREFISKLKIEIPIAVRNLQDNNIPPIDLAQSAIGPGMAIFSRYKKVLENDGSALSVRSALSIINQTLDSYLTEQEGDFDPDTRWALVWFEQFGLDQGEFGDADILARAKNTSVKGLSETGIVEARSGYVRLLNRNELKPGWDPRRDNRATVWEAVQHLIISLENEGEKGAADLLAKMGDISYSVRDLAYRLYTICDRKKKADDALAYNMLVVAWPRIKQQSGKRTLEQQQLL